MRYHISSRVLMISLLLISVVYGQERIDQQCSTLIWDWDGGAVAGFAFYGSQTSGNYRQDAPLSFIPATPAPVLQIPCATVAALLPSHGVWYLVVQAWWLAGERSEYSNELVVRYGDDLSPIQPYQPPAVPSVPLPPIGPGVGLPTPQFPPPPKDTSTWLTETDAWKGVGASPPRLGPPIVLPKVPQGDSKWLTDTCQWKGTCRK